MHDLDGLICIFFTLELDKPVALVLIGDLVSGDVDIDDWSTLRKQFPEDTLVHLHVDITCVDCCLLISLIQ